jgi:hypothetical protein
MRSIMCPLMLCGQPNEPTLSTMDIWTAARGSVDDFSALGFNPKWGRPRTIRRRLWVINGPLARQIDRNLLIVFSSEPSIPSVPNPESEPYEKRVLRSLGEPRIARVPNATERAKDDGECRQQTSEPLRRELELARVSNGTRASQFRGVCQK